jgi:hypothetical protein
VWNLLKNSRNKIKIFTIKNTSSLRFARIFFIWLIRYVRLIQGLPSCGIKIFPLSIYFLRTFSVLVPTSHSFVRYFSNIYTSFSHKGFKNVTKSSGFLLTLTSLSKGFRSRAEHQLLKQVWLAAMATGPNSLHDAGSWFTRLGYTQVAIVNMTFAPMYVVYFLLSLS